MSWYWVVLLVLGVNALCLFVFWLLTRGTPKWAAELSNLRNVSNDTRHKEELAAERLERGKVEGALKVLVAEYREVAAWYNSNRERIDDEAHNELSVLAGDPDVLDAKLDALLREAITNNVSVSYDAEATPD